MRLKPKRYQHQRCLHFITFSCHRRQKLLASAEAREVFEIESQWAARKREKMGIHPTVTVQN